MEFSSKLAGITRILLRPNARMVEVYLHSPSSENQGLWMAVLDIEDDCSFRYKGTGISRRKEEAFIKALVEVGENIIVRRDSLKDRGGIAGGFLGFLATERAKNELCERDAFLFHYRNVTPFLSREEFLFKINGPKIIIFEMRSRVAGYRAFLATSEECSLGTGDCILLGFGSDSDPEVAKQKATNEFSTMFFDHARRPGWCAELEKGKREILRLPDLHHVASRDSRNILRFKKMCSITESSSCNSFPEQIAKNSSKWGIEYLKSPFCFVKYVRVSNPMLAPLTFGGYETSGLDEGNSPLRHPVW
jgi:hypothetical protein